MGNTIKNQFEQHPHFPSGEWEGFYLQYGTKHEMTCMLDFKEGKVTGSGSDVIGAFNWRGNYDAQEGTCQLVKIYLGQHNVYYKGYVDENGYWGNWEIYSKGEGFHIWPKKAGAENAKVEKEVVKEKVTVKVTRSNPYRDNQ